jgi:hypothetical protein
MIVQYKPLMPFTILSWLTASIGCHVVTRRDSSASSFQRVTRRVQYPLNQHQLDSTFLFELHGCLETTIQSAFNFHALLKRPESLITNQIS